jgi:hypothetical protein
LSPHAGSRWLWPALRYSARSETSVLPPRRLFSYQTDSKEADTAVLPYTAAAAEVAMPAVLFCFLVFSSLFCQWWFQLLRQLCSLLNLAPVHGLVFLYLVTLRSKVENPPPPLHIRHGSVKVLWCIRKKKNVHEFE